MEFLKAPLVARNPLDYRSYLESDPASLSRTEIADLQYAHKSFGFVIPIGTAVNGAKWVELIAKSYDASEPRTKRAIEVIRKGMLVDKWPEPTERRLFDEERLLGGLARTEKAIFSAPPVGRQDIPDSAQDDDAAESLARTMQETMGYSAILATGVRETSNLSKGHAQIAAADVQLVDTLKAFVADMLERGWSPDREECKVFLARPEPMINPLGAVNKFESILSPYIVWRVPQFYLQSLAEQVVESEAETPRQG